MVLTSYPRHGTHHLQLHAFLGLAHGPLQSPKQLLGVLDLGQEHLHLRREEGKIRGMLGVGVGMGRGGEGEGVRVAPETRLHLLAWHSPHCSASAPLAAHPAHG